MARSEKKKKTIRSHDQFLRRYPPKEWPRKTVLERRDRATERMLRPEDIKG